MTTTDSDPTTWYAARKQEQQAVVEEVSALGLPGEVSHDYDGVGPATVVDLPVNRYHLVEGSTYPEWMAGLGVVDDPAGRGVWWPVVERVMVVSPAGWESCVGPDDRLARLWTVQFEPNIYDPGDYETTRELPATASPVEVAAALVVEYDVRVGGR